MATTLRPMAQLRRSTRRRFPHVGAIPLELGSRALFGALRAVTPARSVQGAMLCHVLRHPGRLSAFMGEA